MTSWTKNGLSVLTVAAATFTLMAWMAGCGVSERIEKDAIGVMRDQRENPRARVVAVEHLIEQRRSGELSEPPTAIYGEIAWTVTEPEILRAKVVEALLTDPDEAVSGAARDMARRMLPREPSRLVTQVICRQAAAQGWSEFVPAMVRSLAREYQDIEDSERAEYAAISALSAPDSVAQAALRVFLSPPVLEATGTVDWTARFRLDAWDVLSRLDPQGRLRAEATQSADGGDQVLEAIRAAGRDLRVIPLTGEELGWLLSIRNKTLKGEGAWWAESTSAVSRVPSEVRTLRLRHVEAVRWAAKHEPGLLVKSRAELLQALDTSLTGRRHHFRTATEGKWPRKEPSQTLSRTEPGLSWGDILSILVIDSAARQPAVVAALFSQAEADRADKTTEYGGLLRFVPADQAERAAVQLFLPRPMHRQGDDKFIASDDMIAAGDTALAHYHFHVQRVSNRSFAGPSPADLDYADRSGRSCIVLTSVGEGVLNLDYYQDGGVVVDLGEIHR
ncbi:MAG: hypothetical protein KF859_01485 [Phycisphaeraceae bacterium]|nr:hypothetical protein [Phycisphaeraceae bacterium]